MGPTRGFAIGDFRAIPPTSGALPCVRACPCKSVSRSAMVGLRDWLQLSPNQDHATISVSGAQVGVKGHVWVWALPREGDQRARRSLLATARTCRHRTFVVIIGLSTTQGDVGVM